MLIRLRRLAVPLLGVALMTGGAVIWFWPGLVAFDSQLDERTVGFNIVTAFGTAIGAIAAGAAAIAAAVALLDQRNTARWAVYRDTLWRFSEAWEKLSPEYKRLLELTKSGPIDPHSSNEDANDLLNFFDSLGFMTNHGHLEPVMCWFWFYDDLYDTWNALGDYVRDGQANNPLLWAEIKPCLDRLHAIEQDQRARLGLKPGKDPKP